MSHQAPSTLSSKGASGAARIRKIFSRIYGTLSVLFGLVGVAVAAFFIWLGSVGGSARGLIGKPDGSNLSFDLSVKSMPAFFVPYFLVFSLVTIALGVLIFRQRVTAAIILLGFAVLTHVLSYFVPALNIGGVAHAILLILTAIIVIAERGACRKPSHRRRGFTIQLLRLLPDLLNGAHKEVGRFLNRFADAEALLQAHDVHLGPRGRFRWQRFCA